MATTIKDKAERSFMAFLEEIRGAPDSWHGLLISLSDELRHDDIMTDAETVKEKIAALQEKSERLAKQAGGMLPALKSLRCYIFSDGDVAFLAKEGEGADIAGSFNTLEKLAAGAASTRVDLSKHIQAFFKIGERRTLGARKIAAYRAMADQNDVASLEQKRRKKKGSLVMLVEDDRFTASYIASILNKDYDIITAETGEDAVIHYIEHVPDCLLLDIHLPGMSGLDTLQVINKIDPEAFVVMLSIDSVEANIRQATQDGAAYFLKKPFTKERLLEIIRSAPRIRDSRKS